MACACKNKKTIVEEKKTIEDLLSNPKPLEGDIWLDTPNKNRKTNLEIDKLVEESMVLINDVNHPARKTYTVFVGEPEPQKSFKEKIKSFFKL
jgi:hypothetical protein